jgi:hypothetical protein
MRKQLFAALTVAAGFCSTAFLQTTNASKAQESPYTQIHFNWAYTPNLPACSKSTIACHLGFTLKDTTSGSTIVTPSTLGPTALSYVYLPKGGVQYGVHSFSLVANGYDEKGVAVQSTAATVTVTVQVPSVNPPTGLVEALK